MATATKKRTAESKLWSIKLQLKIAADALNGLTFSSNTDMNDVSEVAYGVASVLESLHDSIEESEE